MTAEDKLATGNYEKRFQESTRGRVVELLRLKSRTVEELASELQLTDNAVRTHLATLERDGIVRPEGVRRGVGAGKPATVFGIHSAAEARFSQAYVPLLLGLLQELGTRHGDVEMQEIMTGVGNRLAAGQLGTGNRAARLRHAAGLLKELGALAEITETDGKVVISGAGCPVGLAVTHHPAVCHAIETLMEAILGERVHEQCDRSGPRPCCRFVIGNGHSA
jgi:predicted ArsR family transcriptional regulator